MCGIGTILKMGKKPIEESSIALLLYGNEHRGNDASGIMLSQADGTIDVYKAPIQAWKFVASKEYKKFMSDKLKPDTWGIAIHTRYATKGSFHVNANNHPMHNGQVALVHNGHIHNDDAMFTNRKMERSCETDSDILRAFVDKYGINKEACKQLCSLNGSAAIAAFDPRQPKTLLLARSGSPLSLSSTSDFFFASSEKDTLYKVMKPYVRRWNMEFQLESPDAAFGMFPDDTAWIVTERGMKDHFEFKVNAGKYHEPNRATYERYPERQARFRVEPTRIIIDPNKRIVRGEITPNTPTTPTLATKLAIVPMKGRMPAQAAQGVKDGVCPSCNRAWAVSATCDVHVARCPKTKGGCGSFLVTPLEIAVAQQAAATLDQAKRENPIRSLEDLGTVADGEFCNAGADDGSEQTEIC
jgi:hypothetical protein